MFFDMPPVQMIIVYIKNDDCKKGDRNCFPEDRVPFTEDDRGSGRLGVDKSISMLS
jgi:hypothetical protein